MTTFPALQPGSRAFIPGTYPGATFRTLSGRDSRVRHSNAVVAMQAKAEFPLLSESQLESIRSHYVGQYGGHKPFAVPDEFWSGADTPAGFTPSGYQWRYAGKPSAEEITIDTSGAAATLFNVSIELEAVPLSAVVLSGATFNITTTWLPGYKAVAANGATWDVAVSWLPGGSSTWNPGASGIVTTSLTLHLDAGNAASYPGTGTTWTDLSGNGNNGTLVDALYSSANGGFFAFVTASNYVNFLTYSQPAYSTETSFTWDLWVYPKSITVGPIMGNRGNDLQFTKLMVTGFSYYNHISGTDNKLGNQMPVNVWQHICIVKDGTNFYYYRNSILIDSNTSSITKPSRPFWVGADPTAVEDSDTNIASVAVYSRALTATEITQNFDALRGRFGL